ncbi:MAG: haloacid dehalogenase-like hydrolase [Bacillota bacterium]|nr:haloacid dehalogenase-like hydrolase [Bacillota bacterium]
MKTVVFFDINGTLIERDERTDLPFSGAVDEVLGIKNAMKGVNTAARSDKDVFLEILTNQNIKFTESLWAKFLEVYKSKLESYKFSDVWRENADAVDFVEKLSKTSVYMSLITGELSMGAEYKLEKIGLWKYFKSGGFGEDGLTRTEIADAALEKAKSDIGDSIDSIWVIGDTVLDIKTARHLGGKVISIATGANTEAELKALYPDYLINRFDEIEIKRLLTEQ